MLLAHPKPHALKSALTERALKQCELSEMVPMHRTNVSHVVNGRLNISVDRADKIAEVLGKRVEDLFDIEHS